jgi:pteridine reductase
VTQPSKVALITGSARRRLGWHVADALGRRRYAVVIHYNTSADDAQAAAEEFHSRGIQAIAFGANLSNEQHVRDLVGQTLEQFGRIDVLVNCAAAWKSKRFEDVTATDVRGYFEANTLGTFLCCQHAGLVMVKQPEGGSIVTFGDWAIERPYMNYAAYFPSKGAIPTLTRCLAVELGTRNPRVRVNCVLPGPVMLPADLPEAEREQAINATLVKREGRPENVVQAVLHFIDNDFITGACLPVDGGRTVYASDSRG